MSSHVVCLVLSVVALAHGRKVLINDIVDGKLALNNLRIADGGNTTLNLGTGFMNPVSFEGAVAIGLDSLHRTGDCSMDFGESSIKYNYQISQAIHAVYFRKLTSPYGEGSGYYRAHQNTISYGYTVDYARRCRVSVDSLKLDLSNVELCLKSKCLNSTSDAAFGTIVTEQLVPGMNKLLAANKPKVEDSLNNVYCQTNAMLNSDENIGKGLYALSESFFY